MAPPILPDAAIRLTPALAPVTLIFAVVAVRSEPVESVIEPAVEVTLTALAVALAVTSPLVHKETFLPAKRVIVPVPEELTLDDRVISPAAVAAVTDILPEDVTAELAFTVTLLPELSVTVPPVEVTVDDIVISPAAVAEVTDILPDVLKAELVFMITLLPEISVTVPLVEPTVDDIVMSFEAPVEVIATVPEPPAETAPVTVTEPKEATKAMLPDVVVAIPDVANAPVAAVYENTQVVTATLRPVLVADDVTL